ncbi:unnamed protein product, partial [Owenia fusiformis]
YNIYLKKVHYKTFPDAESDEKVSHLAWRMERIRAIKCGSLDKLVECLVDENGELDSTYVSIFLSTYRGFASAKQVLNIMCERYKCVSSDKHMRESIRELNKKSLRSVLSVWLDTYSEDFKEPPNYPCLNALYKFTSKYMPDNDLALRVRHRIDKFKKEEENGSAITVSHSDVDFKFTMYSDIGFMIDSTSQKLQLKDIPNKLLADQLTYTDAKLFKKVVPHHCLGSVWASGHKQKGEEAPSIVATIKFFNAVTYRVIATILKNPDLRSSERAKVIIQWISVAQELRALKNFSSLKAIISGLQSNAVYRLCKVWSHIPKEHLNVFEELSLIFSEENNQQSARELLMKEGTAKTAARPQGHTRNKSWSNFSNLISRRKSMADYSHYSGTVPYLGTFLTDLTMLDSAIPTTTDEGLINFEKNRKEFEIIAQIKLLQSAAQMYQIKGDSSFQGWFDSVRTYDDKESYELSLAIEPLEDFSPKTPKGHKKKSSISGISFTSLEGSSPSATSVSASIDGSTSSADGTLPSPSLQVPRKQLPHAASSHSLKSLEPTENWTFKSSEGCVIRVSLDTADNHWTNIYKSVLLSNNDRSPTVIQAVLNKYNLSENKEDYCMSQILPDGELLIPDNANVFYAMNSVADPNFVVRRKHDQRTLKLKKSRKGAAKKLLGSLNTTL